MDSDCTLLSAEIIRWRIGRSFENLDLTVDAVWHADTKKERDGAFFALSDRPPN